MLGAFQNKSFLGQSISFVNFKCLNKQSLEWVLRSSQDKKIRIKLSNIIFEIWHDKTFVWTPKIVEHETLSTYNQLSTSIFAVDVIAFSPRYCKIICNRLECHRQSQKLIMLLVVEIINVRFTFPHIDRYLFAFFVPSQGIIRSWFCRFYCQLRAGKRLINKLSIVIQQQITFLGHNLLHSLSFLHPRKSFSLDLKCLKKFAS